MLPPTLTAILLSAVHTLPELLPALGVLLAMLGFGAYHGLNPGMGWLFALSLGLQQRSARAIWLALAPIALGHAAALAAVALLVLTGAQFLTPGTAQALTALLLIGFGVYKIFNYYRHPRWVGMRVGLRDLAWWSFLMATAHGAGLMILPALLGIMNRQADFAYPAHHAHLAAGGSMALAIAVHTFAMLAVMAGVAWAVYKWVGLAVLRSR
ncbi:MAG: hypothetical protein IT329_01535 [Caldilineaceae bacterium]|nr:hypothetical protein [Caldilineaceae bacterium]